MFNMAFTIAKFPCYRCCDKLDFGNISKYTSIFYDRLKLKKCKKLKSFLVNKKDTFPPTMKMTKRRYTWAQFSNTPVAPFTTEVTPELAKRPLVFNGRLTNRGLTSLVKVAKEAVWYQMDWFYARHGMTFSNTTKVGSW